MSRNLCTTKCDWCGCSDVEKIGPDHLITQTEAGRYYPEYEGMVVAYAECAVCGAKYLAWVDESNRVRYANEYRGEDGFHDLSYRSSFNDEPGDGDCGIPNARAQIRRLRELLSLEAGSK